MEALRQIATTSLFLQNEQHTSSKNNVPIIKEPDKPEGNIFAACNYIQQSLILIFFISFHKFL